MVSSPQIAGSGTLLAHPLLAVCPGQAFFFFFFLPLSLEGPRKGRAALQAALFISQRAHNQGALLISEGNVYIKRTCTFRCDPGASVLVFQDT